MILARHMIMFPPFALLLIALAVFLIVVHTLRNREPFDSQEANLVCPRCKSIHPAHANYCARCGRQLR